MARDLPAARARRAGLRGAARGGDGRRPRHARSGAAPAALPHRPLLARPLVRALQGRRSSRSSPSTRARRACIFSAALAVDLSLIFALALPHGRRRQPLRQPVLSARRVNAYYFGRWMALGLSALAGLLYWTAAWLAPPQAAWTAVVHLMGLVGLPAYRAGPRRRPRAARARRGRAPQRRAHGHAAPAPGGAGGAARRRAHGHGGPALAQGRARGAQSHRGDRARTPRSCRTSCGAQPCGEREATRPWRS